MNPKLSCVILGANITAQGTQPVPRYGCVTALSTSQRVCSQHWWRGEPPRQHFCPVSVRGRGKADLFLLVLVAWGNCWAWAASCGNKSSENCNSLCLNVCWGSLKPLVLLSPNCLWWGAEGLSLNLSKWDALSNALKLSLINIWELVQTIRNKWLMRI